LKYWIPKPAITLYEISVVVVVSLATRLETDFPVATVAWAELHRYGLCQEVASQFAWKRSARCTRTLEVTRKGVGPSMGANTFEYRANTDGMISTLNDSIFPFMLDCCDKTGRNAVESKKRT